jgi:putative transposase
MTVPVLIVTSAPGLGELVRRTLVDSGRYKVVLSNSAVQGISQARSVPFELAIIDVNLEKEETGVSLLKLGLTLRALLPDIHLVVLAATSDLYDPEIKPLAPDGIITTPLYPSNILRTIDRISGADGLPVSPEAPIPVSVLNHAAAEDKSLEPQTGLPVWLSDVTRAAQHLTRLSLETAAQAALIVCQGQLWAYAGELPQLAAKELADTVAASWDRHSKSDLARFVHLESDGGEYMLYATALDVDMVLALVFGVETPFSKIRSQVGHLARLLASPPVADPGSVNSKEAVLQVENSTDEKRPLEYQQEMLYGPLLDDIPPPTPEHRLNEPHPSKPPRVWEPRLMTEDPDSNKGSQYDGSSSDETHGTTSPSKSVRSAESAGNLADTAPIYPRPVVGPVSNVSMMDRWELKPATSGVYSLTYGLVLIPRLPDHQLAGDLADRLQLWVPQLCVAFAWQLVYISIRPAYLVWNASAPPDIAPGRMVREIRKHTSEHIFEEFPRLKRENPSGDFWAPGFLLISGTQAPPLELVRDYIYQTRQDQGVLKPGIKQNR